MASPLPRLVTPRAAETLEAVRAVTGGFDVDAWHVIEARDERLFAENVLHGALTPAFLYIIKMTGHADQVGVSATGARHLAAHYKGLQFRLVADAHKVGNKVYCQQFPGNGLSYDQFVRDADPDEADYYMVLGEMHDLKSGNVFQAVKREPRYDTRRDGTTYERPNYMVIAQSKVERNLILHMVPQDVRLRWQQELLRLGGKAENITDSVIEEKRSAVLRFAAANAVALDRQRLGILTYDQIGGLGDAARAGLPAFAQAAVRLGLTIGEATDEPAEPAPEPPRRGRPRKADSEVKPPEPPEPPAEPSGDPEPPAPPASASGRNRPMFE